MMQRRREESVTGATQRVDRERFAVESLGGRSRDYAGPLLFLILYFYM